MPNNIFTVVGLQEIYCFKWGKWNFLRQFSFLSFLYIICYRYIKTSLPGMKSLTSIRYESPVLLFINWNINMHLQTAFAHRHTRQFRCKVKTYFWKNKVNENEILNLISNFFRPKLSILDDLHVRLFGKVLLSVQIK